MTHFSSRLAKRPIAQTGQHRLLKSICSLIAVSFVLVGCVGAAETADDQATPESAATSVSVPTSGDDQGSALPATTATVTAAASQLESTDPVRFLDAELRSPVGIAANRGWLFLSPQRQTAVVSNSTDCVGTSEFVVVGAVGIRQTVSVPGEVINRVEIGPGDWGYAAVSCGQNSWVVPLRVVDRYIEVVAGAAAGEPQLYEAELPRFQFFYEPVGSVWRSRTTITVWDQGGAKAGLLDLESGERTPPPPVGFEAQMPSGAATVLLATVAQPERVYYVAPDLSCHGGSPDEVSTPRVISAAGDDAVAADPGVAFRGLAQMIFGPQDQVAWLNVCNSVASIWTATVNSSTGRFDSIAEALGRGWLSDNGWSSGGFAFGLRAISIDERGSMVAWAHTEYGLEAARSGRNEQGLHTFGPPEVALAVDPGPPEPVHAPRVLDTAQPSDVLIGELASGRAAGTADRAGLVFYGLDVYQAEPGVDGCDDATAPVFGFGASSVPERVAIVPGHQLTKFQVDWQGQLVAFSACDETVYVSVGEFDLVSRTIVNGTLQVWKIDEPQTQPNLLVTGEIRWGPRVLDLDSGTWPVVRSSGDAVVEKGHSDSGRYRYFAEPGFLGDETGPIDPTLRLMVEDTSTGMIRPVADSPVGVAAHRLIFGPDDEVAWLQGNELGTGAALGRMDWSTGEIIEVKELIPPYWAYPKSGSGRPGPDAIAFEADGTLRAWAYTFGPAETRSSENWIVDTLTFSLGD